MTATKPITRDDLESKMRELQGEVGSAAEQATAYALVAGAAVVVVTIAVAYWFGRRRGRRRSTIVEVRRL